MTVGPGIPRHACYVLYDNVMICFIPVFQSEQAVLPNEQPDLPALRPFRGRRWRAGLRQLGGGGAAPLHLHRHQLHPGSRRL